MSIDSVNQFNPTKQRTHHKGLTGRLALLLWTTTALVNFAPTAEAAPTINQCATNQRVIWATPSATAGSTSSSFSYGLGGTIDVDLNDSYTVDGLSETLTFESGFGGYPQVLSNHQLVTDAYSLSNFNLFGSSNDPDALSLWVNTQLIGTVEHRIRFDFTGTTPSVANGSTILGISHTYPNITNVYDGSISVTAIQADGSAETDYSDWAFMQDPSQAITVAGDARYSTAWASATATANGFVLVPGTVDRRTFSGDDDSIFGQILLPSDANYREIIVTRNLEATGNIFGQDSTAGSSSAVDYEYFNFYVGNLNPDYGDAPNSYGTRSNSDGARHLIGCEVYLGNNAPDGDDDGQPGNAADDDGADEDGVTLTALAASDTSYTIPAGNITVTNTTSDAATLHAWIDFDGNGTFDTDEYASQPVVAGTTQANLGGDLVWSGAGVSDMTGGTTTYARFRVTTDTTLGAGDAKGLAQDGEVEDYALPIAAAVVDTDGDGIPDSEEGTGDRDGDGIPNNEDFDPQGYFYDESTGKIIPGGSISVTPPAGGSVNLVDDGSSTSAYQWIGSGAAGIYTQVVTPPPGYTLSTTCVKSDPPAYDPPTGGTGPISLGAGQDGTTGVLTSSDCASNPYYLTFDLESGDPLIINNNLPLTPILDYGDAPDSYGTDATNDGGEGVGASHLMIGGIHLGTAPDSESDAATPLDGTGDGADEDGISLATLTAGDTSYNIPVGSITATGTGTLHAWIDFDKDGTFESDEYASVAVTNGTPATGGLSWSGLTGVTAGNTYARFRFTSDTSINANTPGGRASDGEVEDYQLVIQAPASIGISGRVFEDINYGGGAGRDYSTADAASTLPIDSQNVTVELYELQGGNYIKVADTTTAADGTYSFGTAVVSDNSTYRVRVVNTTVKSRRTGGGDGEIAVQTFRNDPDATTSAITNEVGGATPDSQDAGTQSNGTNLSSITAQSVTEIAISGSGVANVDFGFNFDTIVNTNNLGQGSLAQFIINANELGDEASLAQQGNRKDKFNANESLPAGFENSIFMIPSANDPLGRTADPNFDASRGVAQITATADLGFLNGFTPGLFADNTNLDATTQTVNIGDTNAGTLGTGGTVGVNGLTLDRVQRPEVEIVGNQQEDGLGIAADNVSVRGFAMYNFRHSIGAGGLDTFLIEQNILGSPADSHTDPGAQRDSFRNIIIRDATGITIRNNLLGFTGDSDSVFIGNSSSNILFENNECQSPGLTSTIGDCIVFFNTNSTGTVRGNLLNNAGANGVDLLINADNFIVENNTITDAGQRATPSGPSSTGVGESAGVRISNYDGPPFNPDANTSDNNTVRFNIISGSTGQGVQITGGTGNLVTQNSLFDNTGIGINLGTYTERTAEARDVGIYPFQTPNEGIGGSTSGANGLIDFPVFESAELVGGTLTIRGFAPAGANLEIFIADPPPNPDPLPAGFSSTFNEGQEYLVTLQEGSGQDTDTTVGTYVDDGTGATTTKTQNRFEFSIPVPTGVFGNTLTPEDLITATATVGNNTSEFSGAVSIGSDFGDAPDTYGTLSTNTGARHGITPGLFIGANSPDADSDGFGDGTDATTNATDDDTEGSGDEGGITFPALEGSDSSYSLTVPVTNQLGRDANLVGWIDLDGNGTFDTDEAATVVVPTNSAAQSVTLNWANLPGITGGDTYVRLRLTTDSSIATGTADTSMPTGSASDGEVEDYQFAIAGTTPASPGTLNYPNSGNGKYPGSIAMLDWAGSSFDDGIHDGDVIEFPLPACYAGTLRATVSNVVQPANAALYRPTDMQTWSGASMWQAYNGPGSGEALYIPAGPDVNQKSTTFTVTWELTINGQTVTPDIFVFDAEATNQARDESITATTNGGPWSLVDNAVGDGYVLNGLGTQTMTFLRSEAPSHSALAVSMNTTETTVSINGGDTHSDGGRQGVAFGILLPCDHGDAPASYGDSVHAYQEEPASSIGLQWITTNQLHLGSTPPDSELAGQANTDANGDDNDSLGDDEDGINLPQPTAGATSYTIPTSNISAVNNTGADAILHAWVDFNKDGDFDTDEYTTTTINTSGVATGALVWSGITVGAEGDTYARFRLTTDSDINANTPSGVADDGEVEDYQVEIIADASDPNVLLVKRITRINNDTITSDGTNLAVHNATDYAYDDNDIPPVSDPNNPAYDDTDPDFDPRETDQWPTPLNTYMPGGTDGGNVLPNDEIEYTIYFLSSGDATAESVVFCDYVPGFTSFIPNAYTGSSPQAPGGVGGASLSVELYRNGITNYHTGVVDGDSATYFAPGIDPATQFPNIDCDGDGNGVNTNTNGAIVVNLGDLPNAATDPTGAYGYVRFRARVK